MFTNKEIIARLAAKHPDFSRKEKKTHNNIGMHRDVNRLDTLAKRYHDYYFKLQAAQLLYSLQPITSVTTHTPYQHSHVNVAIHNTEPHAQLQYTEEQKQFTMRKLSINRSIGKYSVPK